jgi:hypothetical protein
VDVTRTHKAVFTLSHVVGFVAIAKLDSFVDTGGCTRGNSSTETTYEIRVRVERPGLDRVRSRTFISVKVDLDGGVATRVEDLQAFDSSLQWGHD